MIINPKSKNEYSQKVQGRVERESFTLTLLDPDPLIYGCQCKKNT